ncbi:MAG TPA: glycoside hydrolase family 15 protein [Dehalococcoidia bacterium]|nr:glycoside hydrolase family 15 protein [Dehalococcoidia bacterium]
MADDQIKDYGVIGDMHSAALVSKRGGIDWLCFPRFDSPSVFAALLDREKGGTCAITPVGEFRSEQDYLPESNILVTTFETVSGTATVTDFMPIEQDVTRSDHEVVRIVRGVEGTVDLRLIFEPRLNYARNQTELSLHGERVAYARQGKDCLGLSAEVPLSLDSEHSRVTADFNVRAGDCLAFLLRWQPPPSGMPSLDDYDVHVILGTTEAFWRFVVQDWRYLGRWGSVIKRSMLALHLLLYAPTGAVTAAVTTSLPGNIGGVRNWDYRFCWLRDASFTMDIFNRLGHTAYTRPFITWLAGLCLSGEEPIRPFYPITREAGEMQEVVLPHLDGYLGSKPVRIGNAAYNQFQLDIYGEVMLSFDSYQRAGGVIDNTLWGLAELLTERAIRDWGRPDSGIWEMRSEPKHFVYSKLMAWVAVDRGLRMAHALRKPVDFSRWLQAREAIRQDILEKGWSQEKQAFVQHYGSQNMDASILFMPMVGFLPPEDPRIVFSVQRVQEELMADGFVRRYNTWETNDGLPGPEGVFTLCTLWLAGVLIVGGNLEEGQELFERVVSLGNHLGLYSEMVEPETSSFLGNYPQALTHIGLIHTARNLDRSLNKVESGKVVAA